MDKLYTSISNRIELELDNYERNNQLFITGIFVDGKRFDVKEKIRELFNIRLESRFYICENMNLKQIFTSKYLDESKYFDFSLPIDKILENAVNLFIKENLKYSIDYNYLIEKKVLKIKLDNIYCNGGYLTYDIEGEHNFFDVMHFDKFITVYHVVRQCIDKRNVFKLDKFWFERLCKLYEFVKDKKSLRFIHKNGNIAVCSSKNELHPHNIINRVLELNLDYIQYRKTKFTLTTWQ